MTGHDHKPRTVKLQGGSGGRYSASTSFREIVRQQADAAKRDPRPTSADEIDSSSARELSYEPLDSSGVPLDPERAMTMLDFAGASTIHTSVGPCVVVEHVFDADAIYGRSVVGDFALYDEDAAALLGRWPVDDAPAVSEPGRIVFFEEKPAAPRTTLSGVALYYYPRQALPLVKQYLEEGNNPDQPGRLVEWLYLRTPFYTWLLPGEWYDIGSAETLAEADAIFSQSRDA